MQRMSADHSRGFTLVELLVVTPVVLLLVGAVVVSIILTSSSGLRSQARTQLQLDVLSALDMIEQDIKLSVVLKNSTSSQVNLDNLATDKNPMSPDRRLVKKDCSVADSGLSLDDATTYRTAYWVHSGTLSRNIDLNNGCNDTSIVWQRNGSEILIGNTTSISMEVTRDGDSALGVKLTATRRVSGEEVSYTGFMYVRSINIKS